MDFLDRIDDLSDAVQATSILSLIGQGSERMAEIASRLSVPATSLARPTKRLLELGLVFRDIPFGCDEKGNKRTLYRLSDPFLRFWYAFVLPHYSDPYFLSVPDEVAAMRPAFDVFLGQAWEMLVRETLLRKPLPGTAGRWRKVARWWGSGLNRAPLEVDVVAESADGRTLLVGKTKLSLSRREAEHAQAELKVKAELLPFRTDYDRVVTRLFVAKGGSPEFVTLEWVGSSAERAG